MLIVLVGARGAGKTTLLEKLKERDVEVLQPTTTRQPRFEGEAEYEFVTSWAAARHAWRIEVGEASYGMRKSELKKAKDRACVTVFEPLNLNVFEDVRQSLGIETMTIGLSTIDNIDEQHRRVEGDPKRLMDDAQFKRVQKIVAECDVVLSGDADTVAAAVGSLVDLVAGRGGVVTRNHLVPLMSAGALLTGAEISKIQSASYDLRIGPEILFQGQVIELTDANPRFTIPPYSYAIVSALEHASLPPCVVGRFDLKVSLFFEGIILSNGPQVDPGYKGALFCMLYNGSGQEKLLTLGRHFATIDFTTTTNVTEGYKQKYQLKQRMGQFLTDNAATSRGGAIVQLVDQKIDVVDQKVSKMSSNFWTVAGVCFALAVVAPTLVIPIAWIEIDKFRAERLALEDANRDATRILVEVRREQAELKRLNPKAALLERHDADRVQKR